MTMEAYDTIKWVCVDPEGDNRTNEKPTPSGHGS